MMETPGEAERLRRGPWREMVQLAFPVAVSNLLQRMLRAVDVFLLAGIGAEAVSGAGIGQLLMFMAMIPVWGLGVGTLVTVAQRAGAGDREEAGRIALQGALGTLKVSVPVALVGLIASHPLARLLGAAPSVADLAAQYAQVVFLAFPGVALVHVLSSAMHGFGDTKRPMQVILVMNLVHVVVAYVLIYGVAGLPSLGVRGAGVAVLVAEVLGAWLLWRTGIQRGYLLPGPGSKTLAREIRRVGMPVALDRLCWQAGQAVYAWLILIHGSAAYAAFQLGLNIESLSFMPGLAIGVATAALVGQAVGAKNPSRAEKSVRAAGGLGVLVMGSLGVLFMVVPGPLIRVLTHDPEVVTFGIDYLFIAGLSQVPLAMTMVLQGALRGAGDTRFILLVTLLGIWGVRLPVAAIATGPLGLDAAFLWWAFLLDWLARTSFLLWRYRSRRWQPHGAPPVVPVQAFPPGGVQG